MIIPVAPPPPGRPVMAMRRTVAVLLTLLLLGTAACTAGSGPKPTATAPGAAALPGADLGAQPTDKIADGGELRIAVDRLGEQWNPAASGGDSPSTDLIMSAVLPRLFALDTAGRPSPDPDYLTSVSPDGKVPLTVTYTINPQAVWGSGRHLDWTDFQATWKACNGTDRQFRCADTRGYASITGVRQGSSPQQVLVTYRHGYPDWADTFGVLLPEEGVSDPTTFNQGWRDPATITDWFGGPFTVDAFAADQGVLSLVPSPTWWGDRPKLSKVTFKAVPAGGLRAAFTGNEVDAYDLSGDPAATSAVAALPQAEVRRALGPGFRELLLNTRRAPLDDARVRQAVSQALDRQSIAAADLAGSDVTAAPMDNHVFVNTQDGYRDNASPSDAGHNPATARQTLAAAGYQPGADGYLAKDGRALAITFSRVTGSTDSAREAQQVQTQLKAVGIRVNVADVPVSRVEDGSLLSSHDFQLIALSWPGSVFPADNLDRYRTGGPDNASQISSPALDALIGQAEQEQDPARRISELNQADALLWQSLPSIPLYQQPELTAVKKQLANFGSFGMTEYPNWVDVGYLS